MFALRAVSRVMRTSAVASRASRAVQPLIASRAMAADAGADANTQLVLNFASPNGAIFEKTPVESVVLPGVEGVFGVHSEHVPTISELAPGMVSVEPLDGERVDYFVSNGFAVVAADNTCNISATEAVKVADLDIEVIKRELADATQRTSSGATDEEKAEAQLAVDLYTAMQHAVETSSA